jgi:hypothetical protein
MINTNNGSRHVISIECTFWTISTQYDGGNTDRYSSQHKVPQSTQMT